MSDQRMDQILDALQSGRQRATYGAVAAAVSLSPRVLMKGRTRDPRHSWVVNRQSGLPTGYKDEELHPELTAKPEVLETREALENWLRKEGVGELLSS